MSSLKTEESTESTVRLHIILLKAKVLIGVSGLDTLIIKNKNEKD